MMQKITLITLMILLVFNIVCAKLYFFFVLPKWAAVFCRVSCLGIMRVSNENWHVCEYYKHKPMLYINMYNLFCVFLKSCIHTREKGKPLLV